jgi:hypothetical protein
MRNVEGVWRAWTRIEYEGCILSPANEYYRQITMASLKDISAKLLD